MRSRFSLANELDRLGKEPGRAPVVATASGRVIGRWSRGALFYGGLPYAAAPTGRRRFHPPDPPPRWTGVRSGKYFGPDAIPSTAASRWGRRRRSSTSEDCLYLNVHTPAVEGRRRPVMVWLHGGAFTDGGASAWVHDGAALARTHDVVVVTVGYRLGALGWMYLGHRDDRFESSGNLGLLDQLAALSWVRENISAFGGDPDNVTLFGQSAGAMSAVALMSLPATRGLFSRVIAQSGAGQGVLSTEDAAMMTDAVMREAGARWVDDLLSMPAADLIAIASAVIFRHGFAPWDRRPLLYFGPVLDGTVLRQHPLDAFADHTHGDRALLVGTNRDEYGSFLWGGSDVTTTEVRSWLVELFGDRADAAWAFYCTDGPQPAIVRSRVQGDRHFRVPALRLAAAHAAATSVPSTYVYRLDWCPSMSPWGACHSIDLPHVFNVTEPWRLGWDGLMTRFRPSRKLAATMGEAWTSFARNGQPAARPMGAWPTFDGEVSVVLDETARPAHGLDTERLALWEGLD